MVSREGASPDQVGSSGETDQKKTPLRFFRKKFEGSEEGLKGFVFDFHDPKHVDHYTVVKDEIARYASATYKNGDYIGRAITELAIPNLEQPQDPGQEADAVDRRIFDEEIKFFVQQRNLLKQNVKKAYALVWGQCTKAIREKVKRVSGYETLSQAQDVIQLLQTIKSATFKFDHRKDQYLALADAIDTFHAFRQDRDMMCQAYFDKFVHLVDIVEEHGSRQRLHESPS